MYQEKGKNHFRVRVHGPYVVKTDTTEATKTTNPEQRHFLLTGLGPTGCLDPPPNMFAVLLTVFRAEKTLWH